MTTRAAQQALTPGRAFLMTSKDSSLQQLGVVLKKAPLPNKLLTKGTVQGDSCAPRDSFENHVSKDCCQPYMVQSDLNPSDRGHYPWRKCLLLHTPKPDPIRGDPWCGPQTMFTLLPF